MAGHPSPGPLAARFATWMMPTYRRFRRDHADRRVACRSTQSLLGRHLGFQLFKPVQDDVNSRKAGRNGLPAIDHA